MVTPNGRGHSQTIRLDDWLNVLQSEYLEDYIALGGSSVKFISGSDAILKEASQRIQRMAMSEGYFTAFLDPSKHDSTGKKPDLHRIDKFFFNATKGVDWKSWAEKQARIYLERRGIFLREDRKIGDLDGIAEDNQRQPEDLINQYQSEFATPQIKDAGLALEFRAAVTALGRAQLIPDAVNPTTEEVVLAWLSGKTLPGASNTLKKVQIYERINPNNARNVFVSLTRWLPQTGHKGLVLILDFRHYEYKKLTKAQKQSQRDRRIRDAITARVSHEELERIMVEEDYEPDISYTDAAYMQMLNLLRRFIDEIDWFERMQLIVLTTPQFYDMASRRNYHNYDALQTRIGQEVHDALRTNSSASLVHFGGGA